MAQIGAAGAQDLPAILDLLTASRLPVDGLDAHLADTLVARAAGRLVGCAAVEVYGGAGLLRSVAVDAGRRGEGVGRELTAAAIALARRRGVRALYLLTTTAGSYFPRFGFRAIPRAELDPALAPSAELRGACPATAVAMRAELAG